MTYKLYTVLGLNKNDNPSQNDIKRAYKKMAMEYHPDKNKGDDKAETKFKEISNAYEILSDDNKKKIYDQVGDEGYNINDAQNPFDSSSHADIFEQFFSGGNPFNKKPFRGGPFGSPFGDNFGGFSFDMGGNSMSEYCENINKIYNVSLEEAFNGINKNIQIHLTKNCQSCINTCKNCNGKGIVKQVKHMGVFTQIFTGNCSDCKGTGYKTLNNKSCSECKGNGNYLKNINANLNIPKGFPDNYKTVFEGMGEQPYNPNQKPGNLILDLKIAEHNIFKREGNDLHYKCKISYIESIIGKVITIPYFNEEIRININTFGVVHPCKKYILEGKGMPIMDSSKMGNMMIEFDIKYPKIKNNDKINELEKLLKETFHV